MIDATFDTQPIDIAFLEPESCLAVPLPNGGVKVHSQSQGSVYDHAQIARILNLDPSKIEIALAASGGAFGAKEELSIQGQTAVAALLLQRPVKTVLTRKQSTQHHVKRHAMTMALTVAADADGRLRASFEILWLSGWVPHESQQKPLKPGSAAQRLADALGTREIPTGEKPER